MSRPSAVLGSLIVVTAAAASAALPAADLAAGATGAASAAGVVDPTAPPPRPRDPFVFRCVLDGDPRTVVVALAEDLWLSYDAVGCRLVKAWDGDVDFRGAVFDTTHGPQPTSRGVARLEGPGGSGWRLQSMSGAVDRVPLTATFLGYRIEDGRVVLRTRLTTAAGGRVVIEERPTAIADPDATDRHRLRRTFSVAEGRLPSGVAIAVIDARPVGHTGEDRWRVIDPSRGLVVDSDA